MDNYDTINADSDKNELSKRNSRSVNLFDINKVDDNGKKMNENIFIHKWLRKTWKRIEIDYI